MAPLRGRDLRYLLTWILVRHGPLTVARLVGLTEAEGFVLGPRPSKAVSDALRWEIARGRVDRVGWGRYAAKSIPTTTARRIRRRVKVLRVNR